MERRNIYNGRVFHLQQCFTSVLLCGSRFARSGVAGYRGEDSFHPPSKLAKSVYFCDFYGARFCCKVCLRFLENANNKLEILLLV